MPAGDGAAWSTASQPVKWGKTCAASACSSAAATIRIRTSGGGREKQG
jgi:hypothetical protein